MLCIMVKSSPGQSSQELLSKLDEQLKECPGEQRHGLDYAVHLEEVRKVSS